MSRWLCRGSSGHCWRHYDWRRCPGGGVGGPVVTVGDMMISDGDGVDSKACGRSGGEERLLGSLANRVPI